MIKYHLKKIIKTAFHFFYYFSGATYIFGLPTKDLSLKKYFSKYFSTYNPPFTIIYPSKYSSFSLPKTIPNQQKIQWKFKEYIGLLSDDFGVLKLKNGKTLGQKGAILTKENILIRDLSREFGLKKHTALEHIRFTKPKKYNGNVAILSTEGSNVFYHWLFDILPRIHLLKKAEIWEDIDYFILPEIKSAFQEETLRTFNIPTHKMIFVSSANDFICAEYLFVASLPSLLGSVESWSCSFLRSHFFEYYNIAPSSVKKRIYITREQSNGRQITNNVALFEMLQRYGFQKIYSENLTFKEQVQLFADAECVIAPHGGGLSNIIFCERGTKIVDIFHNNMVVQCFWIIAEHNHLDYYYYLNNHSINNYNNYWEGKNSNTIVDINHLETFIKSNLTC